jgi:hypothetical protein
MGRWSGHCQQAVASDKSIRENEHGMSLGLIWRLPQPNSCNPGSSRHPLAPWPRRCPPPLRKQTWSSDPLLVNALSDEPVRVTVRASGRPARRPCAMYSGTGFNAPAATKLHGPVWPPQRRSNSTALVWSETYKPQAPYPVGHDHCTESRHLDNAGSQHVSPMARRWQALHSLPVGANIADPRHGLPVPEVPVRPGNA